ncbi:hypothetical protein MiSe_35580 [Microseira wollei NIES-4236]|uniref:Transposase n=1 Tax=Microseira wollei NIES-4236 TaxID=2530354 RepID=A0AAV3WHX2_9CYAN|nr:hypothetical protein MiSe_35580 [Microseira wollei NIES-4236]
MGEKKSKNVRDEHWHTNSERAKNTEYLTLKVLIYLRTYATGIFFRSGCVTLREYLNVAMRLVASRTNHQL